MQGEVSSVVAVRNKRPRAVLRESKLGLGALCAPVVGVANGIECLIEGPSRPTPPGTHPGRPNEVPLYKGTRTGFQGGGYLRPERRSRHRPSLIAIEAPPGLAAQPASRHVITQNGGRTVLVFAQLRVKHLSHIEHGVQADQVR